MKTIAVSGYFNPIHAGHLRMINEAKKLGDVLIVIVNNDYQRNLKGSKEFMNEQDRLDLIQNIKGVDYAVLAVDKDSSVCETLRMLNPDVFANGGDRFEDNIPEVRVCNELGIEMIFGVGGAKVTSSSDILNSYFGGIK